MYSKTLNPTLHISRRSQLGTRLDCNPKVAGPRQLCTNIFFSTIFACWHTFSQVKIHNQNEWSVTNQIEYTGFRQDSYLKFICRLFYHKGPVLTLSTHAFLLGWQKIWMAPSLYIILTILHGFFFVSLTKVWVVPSFYIILTFLSPITVSKLVSNVMPSTDGYGSVPGSCITRRTP